MNKRIKREKEYKNNTILYFIIGLMFLLTGVYRLILKSPIVGVNYKTKEIIISDGSVFTLVGIIIIVIAIMRRIKKEKWLKILKEIEEQDRNQFK